MNLLAVSLPRNIAKAKISDLLSIKLNKGIENGYYGYDEKLHIMLVSLAYLR